MTDWSTAKCIGQTDLFFDERPLPTSIAKRICDECPISENCLEYALTNAEAWGVWGGLDYLERRTLAVLRDYPIPDRKPVIHGTEKGFAWHRRQTQKDPNHVACDPCRQAYNDRAKIRQANYRKRKREQDEL